MKKILIYILFVLIALSVIGCDNSAGNSEQKGTENITGEAESQSSSDEDCVWQYIMYEFKSFDDLYNSLKANGKGINIRGYFNDYSPKYYAMLDRFESGEITLKYPVIEGYDDDYMKQNILMFTDEAFDLPWIWYRKPYDKKTMVIQISYLPDEALEYSKNHSLWETIDHLYPRYRTMEEIRNDGIDIKEEVITTYYGDIKIQTMASSPTRTYITFIVDDIMVRIFGSPEDINYDLVRSLRFVSVE